jgi:hypothetical protein
MRNRGRETHDDEAWEGEQEHATGGYTDDEDFDYEDYIEREFPENTRVRGAASWKQWTWRIVIVVVSLLLIWRFLLY